MAARNGIGLVKLMGRDSGFIAAYTALADSRVNFCLVPESPFTVEALMPPLRQRLQERGHAVIAVAEGAGQDLLQSQGGRDASGNVKYADIGLYLRDELKECCKAIGMEVNLKYIDPSYTIRSVPANAYDSGFSLLLGHNAVHAGMSGRTNMVVGNWRTEFTHVPIAMATSAAQEDRPEWVAVERGAGVDGAAGAVEVSRVHEVRRKTIAAMARLSRRTLCPYGYVCFQRARSLWAASLGWRSRVKTPL